MIISKKWNKNVFLFFRLDLNVLTGEFWQILIARLSKISNIYAIFQQQPQNIQINPLSNTICNNLEGIVDKNT